MITAVFQGTDKVWLLAAGGLLTVALFRIVAQMVRRNRQKRETEEGDYIDPDNMPDLTATVWRIRFLSIFAAIALIVFTVLAIANSL